MKTIKSISITTKEYLSFLIKYTLKLILISFVLFFSMRLFGNSKKGSVNYYEVLTFLMIVFFVVLIFKKRLINFQILEINSETFLKIEYSIFVFRRITKTHNIKEVEFSYQEEITSRVGKNRVLRIFYIDKLVIKRDFDFDGFNGEHIQNIVESLIKFGAKEIED